MASESGKGGRRKRHEELPPSPNDPQNEEDDFTRLAKMLEIIRETLQKLVNVDPPVLDSNLRVVLPAKTRHFS